MTPTLRHAAMRLFVLLLVARCMAFAQQSGVEVRSPSAKLLDTAPGRIVTASVVITNRGAQTDEFAERLTLPPGCQKVAPPDLPFRLEPGGRIVRVLAVAIPNNMPAGQFNLRYFVQGRRDPSSSGSFDFAITVTSVEKLELIVEPGPTTALAGDSYPVKLRVTNRGNSRIAVQLAHRSTLGFEVSADAKSFTLEGGASREIACRVKTDKAFAKHTSHAVTFDVTATSPSGKTLTASQASVVEIIPLVGGNRDPFHYLPLQLRMMTLAESGHDVQFQTELSGAGSLDEAGEHRIDFLLRGPDVRNASLFGERDEYGLTYQNEHWKIDLGDRVYKLSPLTEKGSLGRGAGVTWQGDKTTAGLFYMTSRYRTHNTEEFGAFVRQDFSEKFSLQGNFLRKTGGDQLSAATLPQNIMTLETHYRRGKLLDLGLEAGVARSDSGTTDFAYRAEARGELPGKLSYALEYAHAGPDFNGYYHATDTVYASISKSFTPQLRMHASFNRYAGNLALNDVRSSVVNRENSWNAGANYSLTKKTELSLEWMHTDRQDILLPAAYDFTEDVARIGLGQNLGKLQFQSFLDLGVLDNRITGENVAVSRFSGVVNWHPTARQTYSVFAGYGPSASTGSTDKSLNAGVSARWQVRDNFDTNFSFARNQFDGLTGRVQDQVMASLRYQFANKSSLSLIGRWSHAATTRTTSGAADESAVLLTYTVPFKVAVSRKQSIGVLAGRLVESSKNAGVPRVVLRVGEQFAVTDEAGNFEFPGLKPGTCELGIVQDSLGPRLAMSTLLPTKVKIRPSGTTRVELAATAAASLAVRVIRHEFADGSAMKTSGALREAGGLESAAIELTNGRDTWRAQTDRSGTATFERLLAGRWTVRIASSDLPPLHTIENPERTLTLAPGASAQLAVRVLPQRRTFRLLDRGTIR
ncbi:MAG: hypothetical protein ABIP20_00830 [Chthoniobacteraceae bacterium]